MFTEKEKQLLLSLVCFEQLSIIKEKHENYENELYRELEQIKIKIRQLEISDKYEDDEK